MTQKSEWRTIRAVVEIKVRGPDAPNEGDLKLGVEQATMGKLPFGLERYLKINHPKTQQGRLRVKRGGRVIAAELNAATKPKELEMGGLIGKWSGRRD